jgi:hypothetical protein
VTTWEYKIHSAQIVERWSERKQAEEIAAFQVRPNELGRDRWEIVGFDAIPLTGHFSDKIKGYAYPTFFKRPAE